MALYVGSSVNKWILNHCFVKTILKECLDEIVGSLEGKLFKFKLYLLSPSSPRKPLQIGRIKYKRSNQRKWQKIEYWICWLLWEVETCQIVKERWFQISLGKCAMKTQKTHLQDNSCVFQHAHLSFCVAANDDSEPHWRRRCVSRRLYKTVSDLVLRTVSGTGVSTTLFLLRTNLRHRNTRLLAQSQATCK